MVSAFGSRAARYARGLSPDFHAIVTEVGFIAEASIEAVARRERGAYFYGMILFDEPRAALAGGVAAQLLGALSDHDARLAHVQAYADGQLWIGDRLASEVWSVIPLELSVLAPDFFSLADAMLVRSFAEASRWAALLPRLRPFRRVLCEPVLADVYPAPKSPSVVLWGPDEPAESLAVAAFALTEIPGPATVVCAGGTLPGLANVTFLNAADPSVESVLNAAAVVVCPEVGDPGPAVAFARRGYGVAATATSGASEFCQGIAIYDAAAARSVLDAIGIALARPAVPLRPIPIVPPIPLPPAAPTARERLPPVTVVIPTYNRPDDLERALMSASSQTYPNLEMLVVNDGGAPVEEVVAAFPGARLHNQPHTMGWNAAFRTGCAQARGGT